MVSYETEQLEPWRREHDWFEGRDRAEDRAAELERRVKR